MLKIKINKLSLNDVLYDAGDVYDYKHELKKIIIKSLELEDVFIVINKCYRLFYNANEDYYYNSELFFSEKKATNVINDYIRQQNERKEKLKEEEKIKEKYKQQIINDKLEKKYIGKPIMIYRGKDGWLKAKCIEVFATKNGIYLDVNYSGHICKLSREGKTWKMWSELEELETKKSELEKRIQELKEGK